MNKVLVFIIILMIIFGGFFFSGGTFNVIFKPLELIIIFGAAICSLIISCSSSTLRLLLRQTSMALKKSTYDSDYFVALLKLMYELVDISRKENMKVLDNHIENPADSKIFSRYPAIIEDKLTYNFLVDSFRQGILYQKKSMQLEGALEEEIEVLEAELNKPAEKLHTMAEAMPGIGILAAVMGIILTMQNLDASVVIIGQNIAAALVGTFMGILGCYCMFGPLSSALHNIAEEQVSALNCVKGVVIKFSSGGAASDCAHAGRKYIETEHKPSFIELEKLLKDRRASRN